VLSILVAQERIIAERAQEGIDVDGAVHQLTVVVALHDHRLFAGVGRQVADDRGHHIGETDEPFPASQIGAVGIPEHR
jgi:hypothetical protein